MTSKTQELATRFRIDLDDVAEWCGLHYGRDFYTESAPKKREWIERYAEIHGLATQPTGTASLKQLADDVRESASDDGCEDDLTVVSKSKLQALLSAITSQDDTTSLAKTFMKELLDSVETLTGIAEQHGPRTLADLMYLYSAIVSGGFIDHQEGESKALALVRSLPSGERWMTYVQEITYKP